jgi:sarcosine oxidase, subunit gamma
MIRNRNDKMLKTHRMPTPPSGRFVINPLLTEQNDKAIINLRGNAQDAAFVQAVQQALGVALPVAACSTNATADIRVAWVGPDDWFVIGAHGEQTRIENRLRAALERQHCAITDVSSGYFLVTLAGAKARDVLAQACPMDFHPAVFKAGKAVGTQFFKLGIYIWKLDETPTFELLVRRSFVDHFWQLIAHCTLEFAWTASVRSELTATA